MDAVAVLLAGGAAEDLSVESLAALRNGVEAELRCRSGEGDPEAMQPTVRAARVLGCPTEEAERLCGRVSCERELHEALSGPATAQGHMRLERAVGLARRIGVKLTRERRAEVALKLGRPTRDDIRLPAVVEGSVEPGEAGTPIPPHVRRMVVKRELAKAEQRHREWPTAGHRLVGLAFAAAAVAYMGGALMHRVELACGVEGWDAIGALGEPCAMASHNSEDSLYLAIYRLLGDQTEEGAVDADLEARGGIPPHCFLVPELAATRMHSLWEAAWEALSPLLPALGPLEQGGQLAEPVRFYFGFLLMIHGIGAYSLGVTACYLSSGRIAGGLLALLGLVAHRGENHITSHHNRGY